MNALYLLLVFLFILARLPQYAWQRILRGRYRGMFMQRLGFLPKEVMVAGAGSPIWIHAVSVGEVNAARPLVTELRRRLPDVRTDIYSFGVTLFELLTRRPPFISQDRDEVLRMHLREPPPWPVTFNKNLSTAMNQLILRMLEKDPGRRPQTMEDVAARLRRIAVFDKPPADQPAEEHAR